MNERVKAAIDDGADLLQAIIEQSLPLDGVRRRQWQVWLAFWGSAVGAPGLAAIQEEAQRTFRDRLAEGLRQRGYRGDVERESGRLVALIDGVSVQATFDPDRWPPDRQLALFEDHRR